MSDRREFQMPRLRLVAEPTGGLVTLRIRAEDRDAQIAAGGALALDLPTTPRRPVRRADLTVHWTAPNAWLLVGDAAAIVVDLRGALAGHHAAIVDVSDARSRFTIAGSAARACLAKGTGVDLAPTHFAAGDAALTRVADLCVLLTCVSDEPLFHLFADRPATDHVWAWLLDAAREF